MNDISRHHEMREANWKCVQRHLKDLKKLYSGKGIIVLNEKIIYASDNFQDFLKAIRSLTPEERATMQWRYVPSGDEMLLG
jgi:hypothetical protein